MAEPQGAYPDLLSDLADKLAAVLVDAGISRALSDRCAREAVEFVRRDWGGQKIYVPMGRPARDAEVLGRWESGANELALCREFRISGRTLERILSGRRRG